MKQFIDNVTKSAEWRMYHVNGTQGQVCEVMFILWTLNLSLRLRFRFRFSVNPQLNLNG